MKIILANESDLDTVRMIAQTTIKKIYPMYYPSGAVDFFSKCDKLPCDLILGTRDPSLSEEEFMKTVEERVKRLTTKLS